MIMNSIVILIFSNIILTDAISYCCDGNNTLDYNSSLCLNGLEPKIKCDSENQYKFKTADLDLKFDKNHNLHMDDEMTPADEYCVTFLPYENVEVVIFCDSEIIEATYRMLNTCLSLVSVFFIFLTLIVYCFIPEIIDLQEIALMQSIFALAIGYISAGIINLSGYLEAVACHFLAYLMYFSFMYSFFWLNILCFHIWRNVTNIGFLKRIKYWKTIYHIYGIGAPILALSWVIFLNHVRPDSMKHMHPGIGESICWFQSTTVTFIFFYGPIAILLIINIIFFTWTGLELWQRSKNCPKTKVLKYRLRLFLKLFLIMGITWIFEILSTIFDQSNIRFLWVVTDALNALEGLIIFLILVVFRKKVKRSLANKKIGIWRLPIYWRNDKDSECEELTDADLKVSLNSMSDTKNHF